MSAETGWKRQGAYLAGDDDKGLAQDLFDKGLIFRINEAALHPYGYAIGVVTGGDGKVKGLCLFETNDPNGVWFDEETTDLGRAKMREAGLLGPPRGDE